MFLTTFLKQNIFLFRILKLFAEENAIEDTMYYLSDALRRGVIESEVFLKVDVLFNLFSKVSTVNTVLDYQYIIVIIGFNCLL